MAPPTAGTKTLNVEIVTGSLFKTPNINRFQKEQKNGLISFSKKKYLEPGLPKSRGCPPAGCNTMCFSTISIRPPASSSKVKKKGKLTSQSDEMWSFVGYKGNKLWKELAIDALTKEILGL
jgi:hypothetical protein